MDLLDGLTVYSLEGPGVAAEVVGGRVLYVFVLDQNCWVHFLTRDRIEVAVVLEVPNDLSSLVGEARLQDDRFVHELVSYAANQVVRHLELLPCFLSLLCIKLPRYLLVYVQTELLVLTRSHNRAVLVCCLRSLLLVATEVDVDAVNQRRVYHCLALVRLFCLDLVDSQKAAHLLHDDLLVLLLELLGLEPADFTAAQNLLVDFLLEGGLVLILRITRRHVPAERQGPLQVFDAFVDQVGTLLLLLLAQLDRCFTETQERLKVSRV